MSLSKVFSWCPLPRKGGRCKAHTASRTGVRRGWATPQMPPLRGNPSGNAAKGRTRRCAPCPGHQHGLRRAPRLQPFDALRAPRKDFGQAL